MRQSAQLMEWDCSARWASVAGNGGKVAARSGVLARDGMRFHYVEKGSLDHSERIGFCFQHGLGGDRRQPLELYAFDPQVHLVALDCRGHGKTQPPPQPQDLRFDVLADDVAALADHLHLPPLVVGGISMGAGVALNLALRHPQRVRGLVLVRPAWLAAPNPPNLECMVAVGKLIEELGVERGRAAFLASPLYSDLSRTSPYTADTLVAQFDEPRAADCWLRLLHLPADAPNRDPAQWANVGAPTLVLATQADPVHPFAYAATLAAAIPNAQLLEIPSKALDKDAYMQAARAAISRFLRTVSG